MLLEAWGKQHVLFRLRAWTSHTRIPWSDQRRARKALSLCSIIWSICITATKRRLDGIWCDVQCSLGGKPVSAVSGWLFHYQKSSYCLLIRPFPLTDGVQNVFVMTGFSEQNNFQESNQAAFQQSVPAHWPAILNPDWQEGGSTIHTILRPIRSRSSSQGTFLFPNDLSRLRKWCSRMTSGVK